MKKIIFMCLLISGCGGAYKIETQPIKVEDVKIRHIVTLDTDTLDKYFRVECSTLYTLKADVDACVNKKIANFLDFISN